MCKWYCTSQGPSTNLKCLQCGCCYCAACLHGEAGKMQSLTKCARCGKKPTVAAKTTGWKDVAPRSNVENDAHSSLPSSVHSSDASFATSLRAEGANQSNESLLKPPGLLHPPSSPRKPSRSKSPKPAQSGDIFSRLTDARGYTGAHKHRFDGAGNGLGKDGRDYVSKGVGHVPPNGVFRADEAQQQLQLRSSSARPPAHLDVPSPPQARASSPRASSQPRTSANAPRRPASPRPRDTQAKAKPIKPQAKPTMEVNLSSVDDVFVNYCGGKPHMDGRTFAKLCKDCGLLDKKLTPASVDLIFSKVAPKGQKRIDLMEFSQALDLVAQKKSVDISAVQSSVVAVGGPSFANGTVADNVRFHDDKSTYTGVHGKGGPDVVAKGLGTTTQLAAAGMNRAQ